MPCTLGFPAPVAEIESCLSGPHLFRGSWTLGGGGLRAHRGHTTEGETIHATLGARILVRGHQLGDLERKAQILEVHGENGAPPCVVHWGDDGHIAAYFPGSSLPS